MYAPDTEACNKLAVVESGGAELPHTVDVAEYMQVAGTCDEPSYP